MQWHTIRVTDSAVHSAMLKACVQEWVRASVDGNTTREDVSRQQKTCGSEHSCSSCSGAFDFWDEMTFPELAQEHGDPLGDDGPQALVATADKSAVRQEPAYSTVSWNSSWCWR